MAKSTTIIAQVNAEQAQGHETRKAIIGSLETALGRPVITFFTSFHDPVQIDQSDVDIIEATLLTMDLKDGLALVISSPGGSGIVAERIVNLCRKHSGTGEFWAVVPSRAKSAATMICMGASKIIMGPGSELGPIDPQLTVEEDGEAKKFSVWNLVESYKSLFDKATRAKGNLEPYLQQLENYDSRDIAEYERELELSEDIAIRSLSTGMLDGKSKAAIRKRIAVFLTPKQTKSHGRPIYDVEASGCGLNVQREDVRSNVWARCYELYIRSNNFVQTNVCKCVETREHSFAART